MKHTALLTSIYAWADRMERDLQRRNAVGLADAVHAADRLAALVNGLRIALREQLDDVTQDTNGEEQ